MTLAAGTRLGPYEILSPLGVGGMGEVYRARDARLGRDVALKVLPREFAGDRDRLTRFEREARTLAALNHPHIAAIYGVEDIEPTAGASHSAQALVLELVEGETLAERIGTRGGRRRSGLPVAEALTIARQIADALDAAHDKAIVHRDLKPANVKITPEGVVKVLDFGIAKLAGGTEGINAPITDSPTITAAATREGAIIGTAAYMSPEQTRGQAVDRRTDVWAFGCVLYEMLAGRPAFAGETLSDTIARVLEREPDWSALPADVPAGIRHLLERCQRKDARQRLRDIRDIRIQLDDIVTSPERPAARSPRRVGIGATALAAVAGIALAVAPAVIWNWSRSTEPVRDPIRYSFDLEPGQQFDVSTGLPLPMTISPDGRQIVYAARGSDGTQLYLRRHDSFGATAIPGTEGGIGPFFSPDGRSIGFASGGFLKSVPVTGGSPQTIVAVANLFAAAWSKTDAIVYSTWNAGLMKVSARGGTPEPLTALDQAAGEISHAVSQVLSNGKMVLAEVIRGAGPRIELVDVATGQRRQLVEGSRAYVSQSQLVFSRGDALFTAPFDSSRLQVMGPAIRRLGGVRRDGKPYFAVGADGTLIYVPAGQNRRRLVWVNRGGGTAPFAREERPFSHPRISPDGTRVVVQEGDGPNEFWTYDVERGTRTRLSATGNRPIWTSDSRRITFQKNGNLYSAPVDDSAEPELVVARDPAATSQFPLAWSRDGTKLLYSRPTRDRNRDVFVLHVGGAPAPVLATARDERAAMFSPDGRWIVYAAQEPGREEEVYVQQYPGPAGRIVISHGGGIEPVWSAKGDEIFYRSLDGRRMMVVEVRTGPSFQAGTPRLLFEGPFPALGGSFWSNYDVTADARRFLMVESTEGLSSRLNVAPRWLDDVLRSGPQTTTPPSQ
jgi:serine/threonine protein kinase/Tol biopolymer transport system component